MGSYSPFDNTTLVFKVYSSYSTDKATGNLVQNDTNETYICNVQLSGKFSENKEGVNEVESRCSGKLLSPATFSTKIKAGMYADATINGVTGRLRLVDLGTNMLPYARATQFQSFAGVFEQTGAAG
jgi:hypothetical protein|tara:strand:- start:262 stop:639 length:378 start_codon:yes stop_codon:yes gene_type:complete